MAIRRLKKELEEMKNNPTPLISAFPCGENLMIWHAKIMGPPESPYENGVFNLQINFSESYPFVPPKLVFKTQIFHPNIDVDKVCVDMLKKEWTPVLTISKVLLSICSLFTDPNPDDSLNPEAAWMYVHANEEYLQTAREWTRKYAKSTTPVDANCDCFNN